MKQITTHNTIIKSTKLNIHKIILTSLISTFILSSISRAQETIELQEAFEIVKEKYLDEYQKFSIYTDSANYNPSDYIESWTTKIYAPFNSYFFFIDLDPYNVAWGHPCVYVFVNRECGELYEYHHTSPPGFYDPSKTNFITEFVSVPDPFLLFLDSLTKE